MFPLLIGGAPCSGKSTLAKALVKEQGGTIGHVDDLRDAFKRAVLPQRHRYPWLFSSFETTAENFWKDKQPKDLLELEIEQARELWPELQSLITSKKHDIFEGVSILPELVRRDFGDAVKAVFLIDPNSDRVRQTITSRGIWGDAKTYADWIKPLELEWVMLHNEWLREQAKKFSYPLVEIDQQSKTLARVKAILRIP